MVELLLAAVVQVEVVAVVTMAEVLFSIPFVLRNILQLSITSLISPKLCLDENLRESYSITGGGGKGGGGSKGGGGGGGGGSDGGKGGGTGEVGGAAAAANIGAAIGEILILFHRLFFVVFSFSFFETEVSK